MRHLVRALLASAAIALLAPTAASANFSFGVAAGEVTSDSAKLWARSDHSGLVGLRVATDKDFNHVVRRSIVLALPFNDGTVQRRVNGLHSSHPLLVPLHPPRELRASAVGTFVTAPGRNDNAPIRFAWTGDTDATPAVGQTQPFWNNFDIFKRMQDEGNHFNIHLGDTIYSDSEVPGVAEPGRAHGRAEVGQVQAQPRPGEARQPAWLRRLLLHWDDHEFINDFSRFENVFSSGTINGQLLYQNGVKAFTDYAPVDFSFHDGLYRTRPLGQEPGALLPRRALVPLRQGERERRLRQPDQWPARPGANRAAEHPQPVRGPGAVACRAGVPGVPGDDQRSATDLPRSTPDAEVPQRHPPLRRPLQGDHQRDADPAVLRAPLRQLGGLRGRSPAGAARPAGCEEHHLPDHRRARHARQRRRFKTLEPGGPVNSGILDVTVGPAATANFATEINQATGIPTAGSLVDNVFFEPQPPAGVGMRCSILDQFSYGEVSVTSSKLTVTPKNINGAPLTSDDGPCGPFVLNYQP